jgi:hypothetical protein
MDTYEVELRVKIQVDAPTPNEAANYAVAFANTAMFMLGREGFDGGSDFNEETSLAYSGNPVDISLVEE